MGQVYHLARRYSDIYQQGFSHSYQTMRCMMAQNRQSKYCACGCGGTGRAKWLPGHDQRLRAAIEREVVGLVELGRIVEERLHRSIELQRLKNNGRRRIDY
jgi:hypothetical protein